MGALFGGVPLAHLCILVNLYRQLNVCIGDGNSVWVCLGMFLQRHPECAR